MFYLILYKRRHSFLYLALFFSIIFVRFVIQWGHKRIPLAQHTCRYRFCRVEEGSKSREVADAHNPPNTDYSTGLVGQTWSLCNFSTLPYPSAYDLIHLQLLLNVLTRRSVTSSPTSQQGISFFSVLILGKILLFISETFSLVSSFQKLFISYIFLRTILFLETRIVFLFC